MTNGVELGISRVLVRTPNWLGDAVMALPAIAAVRRHFAAGHLTIAAAPSVAPVFRERTDASPDRVIDLPAGTRATVALLEGEGFDIGVLLPNSFRSAWQLWRAGVPERWGVARSGRAFLLTRRTPRPMDAGVLHQSDYYRRIVAGLGIQCPPDELPRVVPGDPSVGRAAALLSQRGIEEPTRLVGVAPGAAYGKAKQWAPKRMADVLIRLVRDHGVTCVLVGASHDREAARAIESRILAEGPDALPRVVNLTGHTSLGALAGVIARTSVFVSNDSGAMHLASALGRPVVAIFGPTDERVTRPLGVHTLLRASVFCRPCLLRECPIDHRCMKRITVDDVYDAVTGHLTGAVT